ncbi:helix-turn-helix domain-containing protein [Candidatus Methanomassiliicoccus intestinalis]|uniref:helix-turn-helix domain-containing protein n=1 Tax=Candidatus Methanomassiliicoccus intestinalis TaxID=1406512 RepID=UPI0037DC0F71
MYCVKLLIGEMEGGNSCFKILPPEFRGPDSGVECEIIQCTNLAGEGGCALIRVMDPQGTLQDITEKQFYSNEMGECTIDRISSHQLMAMVMNNNCQLSKIVSESGCMITSAVATEDNEDICWTVIGPNSVYVSNLIKRLNAEGFSTERKSSFQSDYVAFLSDRQEEALRVAVENGYYEVPRKINLDELCVLLNCSKSTLDVTLRNAERKVITHHVLQNRETVINRKK